MKLLEEIIDRVNAGSSAGEWATQSQVAASSAVDKLELPAIPDDAVVDLIGCLIDEVVRLTRERDALLPVRAVPQPGHAISEGGEVMGTSRVAIAGGAFRVRTGNLCTMFRSLESAAEQIALLHDEIERLKARLREQTLQTQQTAEQIHSAVIEALGDAIPDGIDANGHPTEQVVATTISTIRMANEHPPA